MASCFKFSCTIYWVAWLCYMGYIIGLQFYVRTYIFRTDKVIYAESYILVLCIFNVAASFIGCAFVKCNIVHMYLMCCFVLPLIVVNITGSCLGILAIREASTSYPDVPTYIKKFKNVKQLKLVEQTGYCCGYWGYWDHASFLSRTKQKKENMSAYVPAQCCIASNRRECFQNMDIPLASRLLDPNVNDTNLVQGQTIMDIAIQSGCPFPEEDQTAILEYYDNTTLFFVNMSMNKIIHTCGCHKALVTAHANVYDNSHFVFLIVNMIFAIVMVVVYLRNWCMVRLDDDGSDHSLDEDSLSQLSLEAVDNGAALDTSTESIGHGDQRRGSLASLPEEPQQDAEE